MVKIQENYFLSIINKYVKKIINSIVKDYMEGSQFTINISPNKNEQPLQPTKEQVKLMSGQVYDNIKGVTEEDSKKIRNIIRDGLLERQSRDQIAKTLDDVFKGKNPTKLQYKDRLKMIARTESARFYNNGAHQTAKRLGATKKYISIVRDDRTSEQSKLFSNKYGTFENAIPIDEEFSINYQGKVYSGIYPPFMPNDRDSVIYSWE